MNFVLDIFVDGDVVSGVVRTLEEALVEVLKQIDIGCIFCIRVAFPEQEDFGTVFYDELVDAIGPPAIRCASGGTIRAHPIARTSAMKRVTVIVEAGVIFIRQWATFAASLGVMLSAFACASVHHVRQDQVSQTPFFEWKLALDKDV